MTKISGEVHESSSAPAATPHNETSGLEDKTPECVQLIARELQVPAHALLSDPDANGGLTTDSKTASEMEALPCPMRLSEKNTNCIHQGCAVWRWHYALNMLGKIVKVGSEHHSDQEILKFGYCGLAGITHA